MVRMVLAEETVVIVAAAADTVSALDWEVVVLGMVYSRPRRLMRKGVVGMRHFSVRVTIARSKENMVNNWVALERMKRERWDSETENPRRG
jgi:hypothetical protein